MIVGHLLASIISVCITKLFSIGNEDVISKVRWLNGALTCSIALVVMQITKTVHPPAGATALLGATDSRIRALGWLYIPIILLSSILMVFVALVVDNIQRRWPIYWIAPKKVVKEEEKKEELKEKKDEEKGGEEQKIVIDGEGISLPNGLELNELQMGYALALQEQIRTQFKTKSIGSMET